MSIPLDLYGFYPYTKNSTYLSPSTEYSQPEACQPPVGCLLYTSDAADDLIGVDLGGLLSSHNKKMPTDH